MLVQRIVAGQYVTLPGWHRAYIVETIRGYPLRGTDPEAQHARAVQLGHATAWTYAPPVDLTRDRSSVEGQYRRDMARKSAAITLRTGQIVEIEQEYFQVHAVGEHFSNPIVFIRAEPLAVPSAAGGEASTPCGPAL